MKTLLDIQQALPGFNTTLIIGGPLVVRVHEALDASLSITKHRYFITVDFKFRNSDALNIGKPGWLGMSKSECTREANALASRIAVAYRVMESSKEAALNQDTFDRRYTAKLQAESFKKLVDKYCAEIETL